MLFLDDGIKSDLAKSSTILQCVLAILDFECSKFHCQPEVIDVENNLAMVNLGGLNMIRAVHALSAVNRQFIRADGQPTCAHVDIEDSIVFCEALSLDKYSQLL